MFRNVRYYRLQGVWPDTETAVSKGLEKSGFEPCGPFTERSSGWMPVAPDLSDLLARRVNGGDLFRLRSQSRVLPHAVINEELELRIEQFRERTGEAPSAREKRRIKAETRDELLPKSMLKSDRIWCYFDLEEQVVGIDAAQETAAERVLRHLQAANDSVNFNPLLFEKPVSDLLNSVFLGGAPSQFCAGNECRMQDAADSASSVRWSNFDLSDRSIRDHVVNGMKLTHLSIIYDNVMSFVLDENGIISKVKFLGMDDDAEDHHDPLARLDAEFAVITGTLRNMLRDLKKILGDS